MRRFGFQDNWRLRAIRPLNTPVIQPSHGFTRAQLARFYRLVCGRPQAFFRQSGSPSNRKAIAQHLRYISRNGELPLEGPDRSIFLGREALRDLAADWTFLAEDESQRRSNMPLARSYVLGAPPGAGYEATERAVRAFATHTFGERFDYAFVMHDDRPHPHAHLLARALGAKGERLRLQKGQPQALREAFAYELRREGIAVQATLQVERGEWRARESFALHKMRERLKNGRGPEPEAHKAVQRLAQSIGEHGEPPLTATEQRRIKRARDMKAYYLNAADLLLKSPDPDERTLGEGLRRFARWMPDLPPPRIVQAHAIYHARRVAEHIERRRSRDQDRDRDRVLER